MERRGLPVARQIGVLIDDEGRKFDEGFRANIIVEGRVILELKSVEDMSTIHPKQLFTYLKLRKLKLGYLLNFGASLMKDGIKGMINGLDEENPAVFGSLSASIRNGQQDVDLNSTPSRCTPLREIPR